MVLSSKPATLYTVDVIRIARFSCWLAYAEQGTVSVIAIAGCRGSQFSTVRQSGSARAVWIELIQVPAPPRSC